MDNRWFLISKVSMSEGAYAALLISNIMRVPSIEYSDDPVIVHAVSSVMPEHQDIYDKAFVSFFAEDIAKARIDGKKNIDHIRYDVKTQQLEFVRVMEDATFNDVLRNTAAFIGVTNFKNIDTADCFAVADGEISNIIFLAEIGIKSVKMTVPDASFRLPRELADMYDTVCDTPPAQALDGNPHFDSDIEDEYQRVIKRFLETGREAIVKAATPENPLAITEDLNYKTDGKRVMTSEGFIITGAHPESFMSLGYRYAKDDWEIYYGSERIIGADVDSFEVLPWEYARDKYAAYYRGQKIAQITKRFRALRPAYGYAGDTQTVYYCGKPVEGCDPASFYAIGEGKQYGGIYFGADKNNVYMDGVCIPYIDAQSFSYIGKTFFKDTNHVYQCDRVIEGCSPDSASVLNAYYIADNRNLFFCADDGTVSAEKKGISDIRTQGFIAADDERVYYKGVPIPDADGKTARISDSFSDGYIIDAKHVFYFNEMLPASPFTFTPLGFGYAHDGLSVFFRDKVILGADAASFRAVSYGNAFDCNNKYSFGKKLIKYATPDMTGIGGQYYKDGTRVYYLDRVIEGADCGSFEIVESEASADILDMLSSDEERTFGDMGHGYAKDSSNVYFRGKTVKGAIPEEFYMLSPHSGDTGDPQQRYAKDSKNVYYEGIKIQGAEGGSFAPFEIAKTWTDSQRLYIDGKEIAYIDLPTFTGIGSGFYTDVNSVYFGVTILENLLPDSAMVLDDNYIRDDIYICYAESLPDGSVVANQFSIDYNTFDILDVNKSFAFDKNYIFFRGIPLEGVSLNNIDIIGDNYITDGVNIFCGDKMLESVDIATFNLLGEGYAMDNGGTYYQYIKLDTDMPVHILGSGYATDGKNFWRYGRNVENPGSNSFLKNILGDIFS